MSKPVTIPASPSTPKLVMGHILQFSTADDVGGVPADEAIIHFAGDEDSEINIRCPGAVRLAPFIVKAVNNHDALVKALRELLDACDAEELDDREDAGYRAALDRQSLALTAAEEALAKASS